MALSSEGISSDLLKIKIFKRSTAKLLEEDVNSWLSSNKVKVVDITYQHLVGTAQNKDIYSCMVTYSLGGYY